MSQYSYSAGYLSPQYGNSRLSQLQNSKYKVPYFSAKQISPEYQHEEINPIYSPENTTFLKNDQVFKDHEDQIYSLEDTISQLKIKLTKQIEKTSELQSALNQERAKSFELIEIKRRLMQELQRMQFELQKISSYENLESKEANIKNKQLNDEILKIQADNQDLSKELYKLRKEHRTLMTQYSTLHNKFNKILVENGSLLEKYDNLEIAQKMNTLKQGNSTIEFENSLIRQKQHERQWKESQLRNNFISSFNTHSKKEGESVINLIQQFPQATEGKQFQYSGSEMDNLNSSFKMTSKMNNFVSKEGKATAIKEMRQNIITNMLHKYYHKAVAESNAKKTNAIQKFIQIIMADLAFIGEKVLAYLESRQFYMETNKKLLDSSYAIKTDQDRFIEKVYKISKQGCTNEDKGSYFVALFRLLTILDKATVQNHALIDQVKHSALKIIYHLHQNKQ